MLARPYLVYLVTSLVLGGIARAEIRPEFLMDADPEVHIPEAIKKYSPRLKSLWLEALARPEQDMQRMAAETIARAQTAGVPGLDEAVPVLEKLLAATSAHPTTRAAVARALIALDAKNSASLLFDVSQRHEGDLRQLIEPALAEWDFQPIRDVWLKRLVGIETRQRDLILAIRGLARTHESAARPALQEIVRDRMRRPDVRLEAAQALGSLVSSGLEDEAEHLGDSSRSPSVVDRLCAARLLVRHDSESARGLLLRLAMDSEPTVAARALGRLNEIDPALVLPLAETAMTSADPHVRQHGADSFIQRPTPARMQSLARLLDDPHPTVRGTIREAFFRLDSTAELSGPVRQAALHILAEDGWRGQEQASLLLAALDHKPAVDRMLELLESNRPEVMVASAWGLRKLEVPQTLPAILDKATRQTEIRKSAILPGLDYQVAHLFEACARMQYVAAEPLIRQYVPKNHMMGEFSRGAAIWSLGWMHAGKPDEDLARQFIERLTENPAAIPPEVERVRLMSAVSVARMKAVSQTDVIRTVWKQSSPYSQGGQILRWAVTQLTGEELPAVGPRFISPGLWFLEPVGTFDPYTPVK